MEVRVLLHLNLYILLKCHAPQGGINKTHNIAQKFSQSSLLPWMISISGI